MSTKKTSWISVLIPGDGDPRHGLNGYTSLGCRCDICRAAMAEYQLRRRERLAAALLAGEVAPPHGTESTYVNYRCRCQACRRAYADAGRRRRRYERHRVLAPHSPQPGRPPTSRPAADSTPGGENPRSLPGS